MTDDERRQLEEQAQLAVDMADMLSGFEDIVQKLSPEAQAQYVDVQMKATAMRIALSCSAERGEQLMRHMARLFEELQATNGEQIMVIAAAVSTILSYDDVTPEVRAAVAFILQEACDKSAVLGEMYAKHESKQAIAEAMRAMGLDGDA